MCFKSPLGDSNVKPGFRTVDFNNNEIPHVSRGLLVCLGSDCPGLSVYFMSYLYVHCHSSGPDFLGFKGLMMSP